jgi:hypothetical protein
MAKDILEELRQPFNPKHIEWRAGSTNKGGTRALALAYAPSRVYMARLDEVMGTEWEDTYSEGPDGGVMCSITLHFEDGSRTRSDGAENTNFESVKGGFSDAFKRACVKWGVGRYLYYLPAEWVRAEKRGGNSVKLLETPELPSWAVPEDGSKLVERKKMSKAASPETLRPFDAVGVAQYIERRAKFHRSQGNSYDNDAGKGAMVGTLDELFGSEQYRKAGIKFLTGKASTKEWEGWTWLAFKDWISIRKVDGEWVVPDYVQAEAETVLRKAMKEQGQKDLL